jgi:hypothetical protein
MSLREFAIRIFAVMMGLVAGAVTFAALYVGVVQISWALWGYSGVGQPTWVPWIGPTIVPASLLAGVAVGFWGGVKVYRRMTRAGKD